ncbi:hypothetical protein P280DRAFT_373553, partial [Massarina eburnea CBS 473.64]
KLVRDWIDEIPDAKLEGGISRTVYFDRNLRLDLQGITTHHPRRYNLQVQVNSGCTITNLARVAPRTMACALVPVDEDWSAKRIKNALKKSI